MNNLRIAVSNTGPLVSIFQSNTADLLPRLYDQVLIPDTVLAELVTHGTGPEILHLQATHLVQVITLHPDEKVRALEIANEIASSYSVRHNSPEPHHAEAEAIVLAERKEANVAEILLDERAAFKIAQARELPVTGFAGILIRACQRNFLSPDAARTALLQCQAQGTHYSNEFISQIYVSLTKGTQ